MLFDYNNNEYCYIYVIKIIHNLLPDDDDICTDCNKKQ